MTTITIKIEAPELAEAIALLAQQLSNQTLPAPTPAPTPAPKSKPVANAVSLETVREKLSALGETGKKGAVKELFAQFGIAKLTDLPAEKLGDMLAAAEEKL
jgi:hypothetical protein